MQAKNNVKFKNAEICYLSDKEVVKDVGGAIGG